MDEVRYVIALLNRTDLDPTDIIGDMDTDLHKRVADAMQDGFIKRFDMRVNSEEQGQRLGPFHVDARH